VGELTAGFKGLTSKVRGREGRGKWREGEGKREGKGKGREKGRGRVPAVITVSLPDLGVLE